MEQIITLFINRSKAGKTYLSGMKDGKKVIAQLNSKRPGKADPDYRLSVVIKHEYEDDVKYINCGALWCKKSRSGKNMVTGKFGTKDKEVNVVGFLNVSKDGHTKYYSIYKEEPRQMEEKPVDINVANTQAVIYADDDIQF